MTNYESIAKSYIKAIKKRYRTEYPFEGREYVSVLEDFAAHLQATYNEPTVKCGCKCEETGPDTFLLTKCELHKDEVPTFITTESPLKEKTGCCEKCFPDFHGQHGHHVHNESCHPTQVEPACEHDLPLGSCMACKTSIPFPPQVEPACEHDKEYLAGVAGITPLWRCRKCGEYAPTQPLKEVEELDIPPVELGVAFKGVNVSDATVIKLNELIRAFNTHCKSPHQNLK